jgi:hypothetical protein
MEMMLLALLQAVAVEAGAHDRSGTPMVVDAPALADGPVTLDGGGLRIAGQVSEKRLWFVLPELKKGATARFAVKPGAPEGVPSFRWTLEKGVASELDLGGRKVLRYMHAALDEARRDETYKIFHHVYSPDGSRLLTKGAGGKFPHHRGLYYGFNKVTYGAGKTCDVWHCTGQAHQAHQDFLLTDAGPAVGRHRVAVGWHGQAKELFAREERELAAWNVPGGILIDFSSRLEAKIAPVKLDGDPQHAGFHFRADNEVNDKTAKQTVYVRPDGPGKPGETRNWPGQKTHVDLPWNAMSFVLGDKRYTAVYLDRPDNPKEARFSERDYGRFGSYFATTVEADRPLTVRYRVWIQEGQADPTVCAARHADFIDPPKASLN